MWKELVDRLRGGCQFFAPTSSDAIPDAEEGLSLTFPDDLRNLLLETNGIQGPSGFGLIWSLEQILKDNTEFRTYSEFRALYMPFDHLLFFGDDGSGDQFAFRILAGAVNDQGVFRWCHETDSREWSGGNLRDYLARSLGHDSFFSTLL